MDLQLYLQYNCKSSVDLDHELEILYSNMAHVYVYATILIPVPSARCPVWITDPNRISCLTLLVLAISCCIFLSFSSSYILPNPVHLASSCCIVYVHACMRSIPALFSAKRSTEKV